VLAERGRLPTGGAAALMFASTPEKQQAAWKFMKFITDATGATGDNFINDRITDLRQLETGSPPRSRQ
jgi:ABC-type glycerol-3-phosphate transport system substrate-binding protein